MDKKWYYNADKEKINRLFIKKYAEQMFVNSFKYKEYGNQYDFVYVENCPLRKRSWRKGPRSGKYYARFFDDCGRCIYNVGDKKNKSKVGYSLIYCIGHLTDKYDYKISKIMEENKKKIKYN